MDASFASMVAVAGTLLGSAITYLFQVRQSRRIETRELLQRLRQERLSAYTEFIAAATDYRRAAQTHWYRKQEDQEGHEFLAARTEADRLQAAIDRTIAQIRLLSKDAPLIAVAQQVRDSAEEIRKARSREEWETQGDRCQAALDQFVSLASEELVPRPVFGLYRQIEA